MEIPKMKEWESPSGWCRRVAHLYGMNETQAEVLEEVRRASYIQVVNDILEDCVKELHSLVDAARKSPVRRKAFIKEIREELKKFSKGAE